MVEKNEIEHLGDLVKVELKNSEKYIEQVEQILNYFGTLDKVEFNSDKTLQTELDVNNLREDRHESCKIENGLLINNLKKDQNNFIRAPKMI